MLAINTHEGGFKRFDFDGRFPDIAPGLVVKEENHVIF